MTGQLFDNGDETLIRAYIETDTPSDSLTCGELNGFAVEFGEGIVVTPDVKGAFELVDRYRRRIVNLRKAGRLPKLRRDK